MVYTVKVRGVKRRGRPAKGVAPEEGVAGRILDSACQLFYKEGLRATGIDRVLSRAGAAKASLYAHFGSKDDLVAAYLERQAREWRALVEERVKPADGRAGLLRLFAMLGISSEGGTSGGVRSSTPPASCPTPRIPRAPWCAGSARGFMA